LPALTTWESVRDEIDDVEANLHLGTIYQWQGEQLVKSDQAVLRVVDRRDITNEDRAEAEALLGSNAKIRWFHQWKSLPPTERASAALSSDYLFEAHGHDLHGFETHLNHYYSGLNALALVTLITELASRAPETWQLRYGSQKEAGPRLEEFRHQLVQLKGAVEISLGAEHRRLEREKRKDSWLIAGMADYHLLTGGAGITQHYRNAVERLTKLQAAWLRRHVEVFQSLGILEEQVQAALRAFSSEEVL
jgi:hypothetical protein